MPSLKERLDLLENDLRAVPPQISVYHDLPFAIFWYPPDEETKMRKEMSMLATRLENGGKRVVKISLASILWEAIEINDEIQDLIDDEKKRGFPKVQDMIYTYLTDPEFTPLEDLLTQQLNQLNPKNDIAFIDRVASLSPSVYPLSQLMGLLQGKTEVCSVLFYPGCYDGVTGLRYMCIENRIAVGNYRIKIY